MHSSLRFGQLTKGGTQSLGLRDLPTTGVAGAKLPRAIRRVRQSSASVTTPRVAAPIAVEASLRDPMSVLTFNLTLRCYIVAADFRRGRRFRA